mmetsp:Transcript_27905/g.44413  ORF Transcript_27905/g.44413 Transcript_27905/m.44413 type:complete len:470 (-) Transcript_27905:2185-3594(-)
MTTRPKNWKKKNKDSIQNLSSCAASKHYNNETKIKNTHINNFKEYIKIRLKYYYNQLCLPVEVNELTDTKVNRKKNINIKKDFLGVPNFLIIGLGVFRKINKYFSYSSNTSKHSYYKLGLIRIMEWCELNLSKSLIYRLQSRSIYIPLPIQSIVIPILYRGKDVLCLSKTGSGKTLCFLIPLITQSYTHFQHFHDLIIAPTRELLQQISRQIYYLDKSKEKKFIVLHGGSKLKVNLNNPLIRIEFFLCTPARLIDILITYLNFPIKQFKSIIIDEADKIFDLGFQMQIKRIINNTRPDIQISMFAAYLSIKYEKFLNCYLKKPIRLKVGGSKYLSKNISQFFELVDNKQKVSRIVEILSFWIFLSKALIFFNSLASIAHVKKKLNDFGYIVGELHSGLNTTERMLSLYKFRNHKISVLLATSLVSRGIDFLNLNLVINYNVPSTFEDYIHRIGRTGRIGNKGSLMIERL